MTPAFSLPLLAASLAPAAAPTPVPGAPDIRSIVPPQPYYLGVGWWWLLAVIGCLVAAALVVWLVRRESKKPAAHALTPRELAARQLRELEARMDDLDAREFGGAVADVLRVYVGAQHHMHPERQTSEEFLAAIKGSRAFSTVEHALLTEFLDGCDLLKFARADATRDGKHRLLQQATDFIEDSAEPEDVHPAPPGLTLGA